MEINESEDKEKGIEIEGVDVDKGIFLSGGKLKSYLAILEIYYTDGLEKLKEIENCLESGNLDLYTINVHALKSASANIGAQKLSETARALETAGEQGDLGFIKTHNGGLLLAYQSLLNNICNVISTPMENGPEEKEPYDAEKLISILGKLKIALDILDAGTINRAVEEMREIVQDDCPGAAVNGISEKVLLGEYDEAAALIQKLLLEIYDEGKASG